MTKTSISTTRTKSSDMKITADNYKLVAAKLYRHPVYNTREFLREVNRIKSIAGHFIKHAEGKEFRSRLVLNEFIIACNCFGTEFVTDTLFVLLPPEHHAMMMTFLATVLGNHPIARYEQGLFIHQFAERLRSDLKEALE
nr:MAG TPA: hypothetical protein [Caudoviricetes sp.]